MKKIFSLLFTVMMFCAFSVIVSAEENGIESMSGLLETTYELAYNVGIHSTDEAVIDDQSAYAFILNNNIVVLEDNQLNLSDNIELSMTEKEVLQDFVKRVNVLLKNGAIEIDADMKISTKSAPVAVARPVPRVLVFELMDEARSHAEELLEVFDNAIFGTAHVVAGLYFTERVKSGGIWDYKAYIGLNTVFYIPEVEARMRGETIGNFHYGYVGSAVFGETTLKTAAGLAQISDGTSDWSYWDSFFDDPRDTDDIQWGIDVYNREN